MAHGEDLQAVLNRPKDHTMIAATQAKATVPFAVKRRHIACAGFAVPGNRIQYAQGRCAINGSQLEPGFGCEGEAQF